MSCFGSRVLAAASLTVMAACSAGDVSGNDGDTDAGSGSGISAFCQAEVSGSGLLDVELDYLPQVVACENGAASLEALKAQAVAARGYLYYRLEQTGSIGDGQGDQVYTCAASVNENHRQAVRETSGEFLRYQGVTVAPFYVAGALQDGPDCVGGSNDPTNTERYVTYNEGKSGDGIEQSSLGLINPGNYANRGCQSQNGAHCLSNQGWDYDTIVRFYYGADIEVVKAEGPCIE